MDAHGLDVGAPQRLFALTSLDSPAASVSADDQRFLMLEKAEENQSSQLSLVQNWFEGLKSHVPTR
jgi:hypothetical protein